MQNDETQSRILIVDDEERGRDTLEMLLEPEGYQLELAGSGREAIEKARATIPDLILLDVMMPEMDGFETCRQIREDSLLAEVPVIFVSALDDSSSRLWGLDTGADDYITKPINRNELRVRVRSITRLNRYRKLMTERLKFEWAVEKAAEGYVLISRDGALEYANPAAQRYLHLGHGKDWTGENFLTSACSHYHCEPQISWSAWPRELSSDVPRYLVRSESGDAASLWLQVDTFKLPAQAYSGYLLCLRDVSEQAASYQYGWSFRSALYHKLRTPLNELSALSLAIEQLHGKIDSGIMELLEIAEQGKNNIQNRIRSILDYVDATHAASESECAFELGDLEKMLGELKEFLKIGLSFSMQSYLQTLQIKMTSARLQNILHELLLNSQKFHPNKTPLVEIQVEEDKNPHYLLIRIMDDGRHMPVEVMDKVWVPFFQQEKYFTGEVQGFGLGLSTIATIIWSSGGNCRLYNRGDKTGVVVELRIPKVSDASAVRHMIT